MFEDRDLYAAYYTERLWNLLPAVYRSSDSEREDQKGPLHELVQRLGAQIAVVRRSIDRTLEDQSIEACDDWLVPYIGDLLATNLVAGLDARGKRLDVAKTIFYRRRKGTVAVLEEIAADITGWNARVVEFFRRLARTRHRFDPIIGEDWERAVIEGLRGARSGTAAGGFADLRHVDAATDSRTAFDEFFHTADFRRGCDSLGWHNISKLGIFLWRLKSFGCGATTPVKGTGETDKWYTFDPTGREIPLFARDVRDSSQYGDAWVTPDEWMLPGPITAPLLEQEEEKLYPSSMSVLKVSGQFADDVDPTEVKIVPDRGRFCLTDPLLQDAEVRVTYHYGFSSTIGAGPYDRRALRKSLPKQPTPALQVAGGGDKALKTALDALGPSGNRSGTVTIADSLTYTVVSNPTAIADVLIRGKENERPVVRLEGSPWVLEGADSTSRITLEGLLVSGVDVVLQGEFKEVVLLCTTLDPGEEANANGVVRHSVDKRPLRPTVVWIEGSVETLKIHRSITGPIRTRRAGKVAKIEVEDSIVQNVRTTGLGLFAEPEVFDPHGLTKQWETARDPLSKFLKEGFAVRLETESTQVDPEATETTRSATGEITERLNKAVSEASLYTPDRFAHVPLPILLRKEALGSQTGPALVHRNRRFLEFAYPVQLAPAAIASGDADLSLVRSTCLGAVYAHRISASESILAGYSRSVDPQSGCVRFSAYVAGSQLHQPYESVAIRESAAIFVSRRFGDPGYAQLARLADQEIVSGEPGATILAGAQNGSEMGAFARELNPIKERGLRIKLNEYMPIGLTPVLIYVT